MRRELYPVRNVHQAFSYGFLAGAAYSGLAMFTGGWWFRDPMPAHAGFERMAKLSEYYRDGAPDPDSTVNPVKIDRQLTYDRLTGVHFSGTRHPEDQPSHLIVHDANVCATRCRAEYGNQSKAEKKAARLDRFIDVHKVATSGVSPETATRRHRSTLPCR